MVPVLTVLLLTVPGFSSHTLKNTRYRSAMVTLIGALMINLIVIVALKRLSLRLWDRGVPTLQGYRPRFNVRICPGFGPMLSI